MKRRTERGCTWRAETRNKIREKGKRMRGRGGNGGMFLEKIILQNPQSLFRGWSHYEINAKEKVDKKKLSKKIWIMLQSFIFYFIFSYSFLGENQHRIRHVRYECVGPKGKWMIEGAFRFGYIYLVCNNKGVFWSASCQQASTQRQSRRINIFTVRTGCCSASHPGERSWGTPGRVTSASDSWKHNDALLLSWRTFHTRYHMRLWIV